MSNQLKSIAIAGALAASVLTPVAANAASIVGLIDGKTLVMIDPASKKVTSTVALKGTPGLLGIDVRPADGMLYGVQHRRQHRHHRPEERPDDDEEQAV